MPTIQYPKNPNVDTAFVEQDDGTKNRALMIAPQDISTLELPSNPNSTKGYVTVDGKKQRVVLTADITGGGGGSVDYAKTVQRAETMPTADASNAGQQFLYSGATDATYTHGYIYENVATTTYTDSTTFDPASISGTTVTATAGALAGLCAEYGSGNITDIIKGTLTYDQSSDLLVFVGLDDTDTQVCTFQLYTQDYTDAGFTFTGTLQDGDVINFTTTIMEGTSYAWSRIDVQPQTTITIITED